MLKNLNVTIEIISEKVEIFFCIIINQNTENTILMSYWPSIDRTPHRLLLHYIITHIHIAIASKVSTILFNCFE